MQRLFNLVSDSFPDIILRAASMKDCTNLQQWKNKNRPSFFYQGMITSEMQKKWLLDYLKREKDFMFMICYKKKKVGCMGFRMLGAKADIYNIILGAESLRGKGIMSQAMRLLCSYIYSDFTRKIGVKVLRTNPAFGWYQKNCFQEKIKHDNHYELELDLLQFQPCAFRKIESQT